MNRKGYPSFKIFALLLLVSWLLFLPLSAVEKGEAFKITSFEELEKAIVHHLHRRHENFGSKDMSNGDIMQKLNLAGKKKGELLDALKRLEKRNIVKLLPLRH